MRWPNGTFMARLTEDVGRELLGLAPARLCPPGDVLLAQGDTGDHLCLLRSGRPGGSACVKVTATLENGSESLLGIRVSGDIVGELAGLLAGRRTATVTTCSYIAVHKIPRDAFKSFLMRRPDAWEAMDHMIADRLDWANRRRLDFAGYDVPVRLARVFVDLVERHGYAVEAGDQFGVALSQGELGRLIGAREDAVGQAMRKLRYAGLVSSRYRIVTITDLDRLRVFAQLG
jgi:CRP-like cAMP-binding protein